MHGDYIEKLERLECLGNSPLKAFAIYTECCTQHLVCGMDVFYRVPDYFRLCVAPN